MQNISTGADWGKYNYIYCTFFYQRKTKGQDWHYGYGHLPVGWECAMIVAQKLCLKENLHKMAFIYEIRRHRFGNSPSFGKIRWFYLFFWGSAVTFRQEAQCKYLRCEALCLDSLNCCAFVSRTFSGPWRMQIPSRRRIIENKYTTVGKCQLSIS